jgi:endonuclease/exonuclease/phosphatase family metal-dependent hydrolase
MALRLCSYNIEHFDRLFDSDTQLSEDDKKKKRIESIEKVLKMVKAHLIGIVEAPDTSKDGEKSTVKRLEHFASEFGLNTSKALHGFCSKGTQEIAVLYDPQKFDVQLKQVDQVINGAAPPFDSTFHVDTDDDSIEEIHTFYRPPLEVEVKVLPDRGQFRLMVVHPKTKGIFDSMDMLHWEKTSKRNRSKLYAQCTWIRRRVDEWLKAKAQVVVMGDMNDGPGMDFYEMQFARSAMEVIMGDIYNPHTALVNHVGRPKWTGKGWVPSSTRFKERFTEDYVNVLIDHMLTSRDFEVVNDSYKIWNPYSGTSKASWNPFEGKQTDAVKKAFTSASDHFPVTLDIPE